MNSTQVLNMVVSFKNYVNYDIRLMIGTMTSYKVLNGQPTKWVNVFPKPENLKDIFSGITGRTINCIHYADYDNNHDLCNTLTRLADLCGKGLHAIQLDMVWPDPKELEKFKKFHNQSIVLQVSSESMRQCGDNPIAVAERIRTEYAGLISHVLLDCSMGKGIAIDVNLIEGYIQAINAKTDVDIAIAGGLGPDTVSQVEDLISKYRVSIDAQSKLRTSGNAMEPIDWHLAKMYLHRAVGYYL